MAIHQYIIMISAVPGREAEFDAWYDNVHLRDVVNVPGVKSAKRYRLLQELGPDYDVEKPRWNSLAIYELDTEDPVALARHIRSLAGTPAMSMSESVNKTGMLKMLGQFSAATPPK
jgi:hypothetical protein